MEQVLVTPRLFFPSAIGWLLLLVGVSYAGLALALMLPWPIPGGLAEGSSLIAVATAILFIYCGWILLRARKVPVDASAEEILDAYRRANGVLQE